ncbi:uroporphyrinogen-III synthase [Rhizobium sp. FKY42]|uniref:uroporphyrinogen-III synthase n=1 Tax=Rhizobium sp. FKY42 TaxID=2562310 RepID=UPI0010C0600E|nr:uroporphyrinogen-III synthase [Rhizobium sp. FKY42]
MRVLITRPRHSAERTAQTLLRLGHQPLILPLSSPHHLTEAAKAALERSQGAIAITSAEAVRALSGLDLSHHLDRLVYAVGAATADEVRRAGFRHMRIADGTGESLARLLTSEGPPDVLYLAGQPRSPDFERGLTDASQPYSTTVCYEMQPVIWNEAQLRLLDPPPQAVLLYSSEAARRFCNQPLVKRNLRFWQDCHFLCLSEKVARSLSDAANRRVSIADQPTEEALLLLLS